MASSLEAVGFHTTQDQPLPNWVRPFCLTVSLNLAKSPKAEVMALATAPVGSPPAPGPMISQNRAWLACPPPLLMIACFAESGAEVFTLRSSSSMDNLARSGADSNA